MPIYFFMQKNTIKQLLCFCLILLCSTANAQLSTQLEQAFNRLAADPQAKYATTTLVVLDATTGKQIYGRNENLGVATASTLKVITAATAFSLLGKDFNYQTTLAYTGTIAADGVLNGDLVIIGGGDPTLGSWRYAETKESQILNTWVKAIRTAGIKSINGKVIGDVSMGQQFTSRRMDLAGYRKLLWRVPFRLILAREPVRSAIKTWQ
jgi:D-alanyl-D-alanine carboxypeptidase/D-alanyl-D-alanine-endopeptidase (penicillin-binding protein 4)